MRRRYGGWGRSSARPWATKKASKKNKTLGKKPLVGPIKKLFKLLRNKKHFADLDTRILLMSQMLVWYDEFLRWKLINGMLDPDAKNILDKIGKCRARAASSFVHERELSLRMAIRMQQKLAGPVSDKVPDIGEYCEALEKGLATPKVQRTPRESVVDGIDIRTVLDKVLALTPNLSIDGSARTVKLSSQGDLVCKMMRNKNGKKLVISGYENFINNAEVQPSVSSITGGRYLEKSKLIKVPIESAHCLIEQFFILRGEN